MAIKKLAYLAVLLCVAGCGSRPQVPTVTPRSTQITGVVTGGLSMRIDLLVFNPNTYDLTVSSVSAQVTAQGHDLGTVEHDQQLSLPAGQNVPLITDLTVPWGDLPSLALTALLTPAIPYRVRGRVTAGAGTLTVRAPFELEGQIPRTMLLNVPGLGLIQLKETDYRALAESPLKTPLRDSSSWSATQ